MPEPSDYKDYFIYPDQWTPPVKVQPAAPPTLAQVETYMKTIVVSKPKAKQEVIQAVVTKFSCTWDVAQVLIEEIEKTWHPVKYQVAQAEPIIKE